jgi:hypothetical protein
VVSERVEEVGLMPVTAVVKAIEKAVNEARRKDLDDFGVTYRVLGA